MTNETLAAIAKARQDLLVLEGMIKGDGPWLWEEDEIAIQAAAAILDMVVDGVFEPEWIKKLVKLGRGEV